jgi:uncharacterized Zn finger protein (UPF0148 family)
MSIPVACKCGQQFMAQPHLAGQQVACPSCGRPLVIPATDGKATVGESDPAENVVSCQCGQSFKAAPHLLGKRVACPSCGQPIDIPGGRSGPRAKSSSSSPVPNATKEPHAQAATSSKSTKRTAATAATKPSAKTGSPSSGMPEDDLEKNAQQTGLDMAWDDALASSSGANALDGFGATPAYAPRSRAPEPIEPMTMYAIWIGVGAVALLILLILGHILWNAFSGSDGSDGEDRPADQPTESAPAEPGAPGEPNSESGSEAESPEAEGVSDTSQAAPQTMSAPMVTIAE